jgi:hypothetical protein
MRRLRRILIELARSERGIALPMALMVTVVGMGMAAVPIVASVNSQGGDQRNQGSNEALAAAETGAEIALANQGTLHLEKGSGVLCASEPTATPKAGWCRQEPFSAATGKVAPGSVGLAHYTYSVLPCYGAGSSYSSCASVRSAAGECTEDPVEVVSTGYTTVAGVAVERRVKLTGCAGAFTRPANWEAIREEKRSELRKLEEELKELKAPGEKLEKERTAKEKVRTELEETITREKAEGKKRFETVTTTETTYVEHEVAPPVFSGGQTVGIESLVASNNAQVYNGGAGSNGPVSLTGSANVCGTVRYGTTFTANNGSENANCSAGRTTVKSGPTNYPLVQLPAEISTKNSNARLTGADPASGYQRGNISWNESKRELTVSYGELTLEGSLPYFLCKLVLAGGSTLRSGSGKSIRIFFDEPTTNNCPGLNGAAQLQIANGTSVTADSNHGPGFYFLGSSTKGASKIELGGGSNVSQFVVYGPRSAITANNGVNLNGVIIGQSLELAGGASINKAGNFTPPSSTEFVAPEKTKEEVKTSKNKEEETTLGHHEDELNTVITEIEQITHQIEAINKKPIEEKENQVSEKSKELAQWEAKGNPGSGGEGTTTFKKSGFSECTGTPPHTTGLPDAGC